MDRFIKKILLFLSFPLGMLILLFTAFSILGEKEIHEARLPPNTHILFLGDSHIQVAIDDHIVKNGVNLSEISEAYIFTYYKLQGLLETNSSIKKVYLGFSYHNLSSGYDDVIYGKNNGQVSSKYFFILPFFEKLQFLRVNLRGLLPYVKADIKNAFANFRLKKNTYSFLGSYENSFSNVYAEDTSMDKRIKFQYYTDGEPDGFSDLNIFYLKQIIDLCSNSGVELVMLNTPLHPYYKSKIPAKFILKYNEIVSLYHLKVKDIENLFSEDKFFIPDGDHVSKEGSLIVSKLFNE